MMAADYVAKYVHHAYIVPARQQGRQTVTIKARELCEGLESAYSPSFVQGVLGSTRFRNTCHLSLLATEGPSEDLPTTCIFKLHSFKSASSSR